MSAEDHDLIGRLNRIKNEVQNLWSKLSENDFELTLQKFRGKKKDEDENLEEDETEESSGVKFYTTENSPLARGAEKETPKGIDRFGEQEEIPIEKS